LQNYINYLETITGMSNQVIIESFKILESSGHWLNSVKIIAMTRRYIQGIRGEVRQSIVNNRFTIVPIYHPEHATYAVIEKLNDGNYRIAIFNGGWKRDLFHEVALVEGQSVFLFPCIYSCDYLAVKKFLMLVARVFDRKDKRGNERVFSSIKNFLSQDIFTALNREELFDGSHPDFLQMEVSVMQQLVGNCAIHNFIQALRYCERTYPTKNGTGVIQNTNDLQRSLVFCQHIRQLIQPEMNRIDFTTYNKTLETLNNYIAHLTPLIP
jgi:hypothetical protein